MPRVLRINDFYLEAIPEGITFFSTTSMCPE
jgi:hypothetical protein